MAWHSRSVLSFATALTATIGCYFTADFERFDTAPPVEVGEAGPPVVIRGGEASLSVAPASVVVRPATPARFVVRAERRGNADPTAIRVHFDKVPSGLSVKDVTIAADRAEASATIEMVSPEAIASLLGRSVDLNVVGEAEGPNVAVTTTSVKVEILGAPGQIDPAAPVGVVTFDLSTSVDDQSVGRIPIHTADFADTTLAVVAGQELVTIDAMGVGTKRPIGTPDGGAYVQGSSVVADGASINAVTSRIAELTLPDFVYEATLQRGAPSSLSSPMTFIGGNRCSIDREGRRASCKHKTPSSYVTTLRRLDGPTPGASLRTDGPVDWTTILHGSGGWVLLGMRLDTILLAADVVDDSGVTIPGFSFPAVGGGIFDGIIAGDGVVFGGFDVGRAVVGRMGWNGALDAVFGGGASVHVPGDVVTRVVASPHGLLVGTMIAPGSTSTKVGRIVRLDPTTGALDRTFGDNGVVTLPGECAPVAIREIGARIHVGYLSLTGAGVVRLFP